ncbi:MAG: murein biosynthesis integral membrane protein MurJ [Planctomycetota bacterium]|jgi:putative peptidoglycan lipid II flippase
MPERTDSFAGDVGVISGLTLLSRVLGLVRDCVCAALFGAGMVWDAFSFAFRVPNLFRRLFGEGALSAAFVPAFTEHLELRGEEEAWRLAGRIAGALATVLVGLLVAAELAVWGVRGLLDLDPRWRLALALTAVTLPYMVLICLTALAGAALHSLRHFAAPALAPVVLNVCWIAAAAGVAPLVSSDPAVQIYVVAGAIPLAGVLQLALQAVALGGRGFRWRPSLQVLHPDVRRIGRAMAPVALGMAALQINVLLDSVIAISLAGPPGEPTFRIGSALVAYPMQIGANSVLYYAGRLMQFPLGVFGIAVATAAFPALSRHAARKDWQGFSDSLRRSLGSVLFIGIPASVGLILVRYPAIELIFQHGAFTPEMTARTARVLFAYAAAVWAYCALHVLTRAFYGLKEAALPAKLAACMVAVNLVLNLTFVWPLGEAGLALATALCAVAQSAVLYWLLMRRLRSRPTRRLLVTLCKTVAATALMALACRMALHLLPAEAGGTAARTVRLLVPVAVGGLAYAGTAAALGTAELRDLLRWLRAGRRGEAP